MITWLKIMFHCLLRLFCRDADHRMCSVHEHDSIRYFCSCGYMNNGFTFDDIISSRSPSCVECGDDDDLLDMLRCPCCQQPVCMTCAQLYHDCEEDIE